MKFGVRYCNTARYTKPENAVELVQAAEAAGFESAWTVDHVVVPEGYESKYPYTDDGKMAGGKNAIPLPAPLIWMSYVGARTEKINLATGILIMPQRNPVVAAKQIATMDFMTNGRVLLGIGVDRDSAVCRCHGQAAAGDLGGADADEQPTAAQVIERCDTSGIPG